MKTPTTRTAITTSATTGPRLFTAVLGSAPSAPGTAAIYRTSPRSCRQTLAGNGGFLAAQIAESGVNPVPARWPSGGAGQNILCCHYVMTGMRQDPSVTDPHFVYILWHGDDLGEGSPEAKLLGVYSSETAARDRIERTIQRGVSGFADHADDFHIDRYEVDKDQWIEGYVEIDPDEWVQGQDEPR